MLVLSVRFRSKRQSQELPTGSDREPPKGYLRGDDLLASSYIAQGKAHARVKRSLEFGALHLKVLPKVTRQGTPVQP